MSAVMSLVAKAILCRVALPAGVALAREIVRSVNEGRGENLVEGEMREAVPLALSQPSIELVSRNIKSGNAFAIQAPELRDLKEEIHHRIASSGFIISDPAAFIQGLEQVASASSLETLRKSEAGMMDSLAEENDRAIRGIVTESYREALEEMGFAEFEAFDSRGGRFELRFAASAPDGVTVVTEVTRNKDGELRLESEVLGRSDPGCETILKKLRKRLADMGFEFSEEAGIEPTGPFCSLQTARRFLEKEIKPPKAKTSISHKSKKRNVSGEQANQVSTDAIRRKNLQQKLGADG
ncbi:MAG: hypothetical protein J5I65_02170 [Aridibacter famidurans]|nr:hypothetical protein [Aridibacter famidurans]